MSSKTASLKYFTELGPVLQISQAKDNYFRNCDIISLHKMPLIFILFPLQQIVTIWFVVVVDVVLACCFLNSRLLCIKVSTDQTIIIQDILGEY